MRARRSVLRVQADEPSAVQSDAVLIELDEGRARGRAVEALLSGRWEGRARAVRVNDLSTRHTYRDVIEVVEGAGRHLDTLVLPRVTGPDQVAWLDVLLTQVETTMGLEVGRIGIEPVVETGSGLVHAAGIAAGPRVAALVLAPLADLGLRGDAGDAGAAGDAALLTVRAAASAAGVPAVLGGGADLRAAARLGFDGAWVHDQAGVDLAHEVISERSHVSRLATGE